MTDGPLLSFIVLSYNYEKYIGQTIRSILGQTVQDFEVVVVDDASADASRQVVSAFNDPRIRLLVNDQNLGGAGSYNRAVSTARGEWLVNLDADDWIAPEKSSAQLDALNRDPRLDIIGTHVAFVDAEARPHPQREVMGRFTNHDLDLNRVENWIGRNPLCRSSTMVRRSAHLRIGLDDPGMVRAPDYELWTRALRQGCRFGLLPEQLTFYRLQARGVTFGDPRGTFLELSYAMLRNLLPAIEDRALWPSFCQILNWLGEHEELARLPPSERYRLLGAMLTSPVVPDFAGFVAMLQAESDDNGLGEAGRRCLALLRANPVMHRLAADNRAFDRARDWWYECSNRWQAQSVEWQRRAEQLEVQISAQTDAAAEAKAKADALAALADGLEALATQRQRSLDEIQGRLADAERKLRWTAANISRAVLSRFYRSW